MNHIRTLAILSIWGLTSCLTNNSGVRIIGKMSGETTAKIEYTLPLNGISYIGFQESVQPDSLGNFQLILDVSKPAIVEFMKEFSPYGAIIIEPGSKRVPPGYGCSEDPGNVKWQERKRDCRI